MANIIIESAVCNHKGNIRANNEDSFYLNGQWMPLERMDAGGIFTASCGDETQLYAVCDGMGGEAAGERASFEAVQALRTLQVRAGTAMTDETLADTLGYASAMIYREAREQGNRSGTTFAGCLWRKGAMRVMHIGDSRVYRMRKSRIEQVTTDHSEVQRMVALGIIKPEEARTHPKRHVISQYIGMPFDEVSIQPTLAQPCDGQPGDRYVICSDGLTDMLDNASIEKVLSQSPDAKTAAINLTQAALRNGGRDNVTVLCLFLRNRNGSAEWSLLEKALLGGGILTGALGVLYLAEWIFRLL